MKLALGTLPTTEMTLKHIGEGNDPGEQYTFHLFIASGRRSGKSTDLH